MGHVHGNVKLTNIVGTTIAYASDIYSSKDIKYNIFPFHVLQEVIALHVVAIVHVIKVGS